MAARSWALLLSPLLLTPAPRGDVCPAPLAADAARERTLIARIAADGRARALMAGAGRFTICFGRDVEPAMRDDGVIQLDPRMPEIESAARVAHLFVHAREESALRRAPRRDCARWVSEALDEEADAHAIEMELLHAAGARATWPFAEEAMRAEGSARRAVIRAWIADHPDGGGGIPPLARAYAARCERGSVREAIE